PAVVSPGDHQAGLAVESVHPGARAAAPGPGHEVQPQDRHVRAPAAHGGRRADGRSREVPGVPEGSAAPARALHDRARHREAAGLDRAQEGGQPAEVSKPLVIAHRGASGYEYENSRAAFRAARVRGADAVELDVHGAAGGRCAVHSFDHRIVKRLGLARPSLERGVLLASYPMRPLDALEDTGATALWEEQTLIDAALVEALHRAGRRIYAWTVNDPEDMRRLISLQVDGLCGNFPDVARRIVDGAGA